MRRTQSDKITVTSLLIMKANHLLKSAIRSRPSLTTFSLKMTSQSLSPTTSFFSLSTTQPSVWEGRGRGASHGAIWQVIPAMEKLLTHLEPAKQGYSTVRPTQDYTMVSSQAYIVFDTQELHEPLLPPTRAERERPKQSQSQCQSMPPPPSPRCDPRTTPGEPFRDTFEYRMLCVRVNLD